MEAINRMARLAVCLTALLAAGCGKTYYSHYECSNGFKSTPTNATTIEGDIIHWWGDGGTGAYAIPDGIYCEKKKYIHKGG